MLLNFKKMTMALASIAMISGLALTFDSQIDRNNIQLEAAPTQTHRRIYAWVNPNVDDGYSFSGNLFIHYWRSGLDYTNYNSAPQMTKVVSDYGLGMFIYDVEVEATHFLIKDATSGDGNMKTQDILISYIFETSNFKGLEIWRSGASIGVSSPDTLGGNAGQVAAVLGKINTCSDNFASGYSAWPQLEDLFIIPSGLRNSTQTVLDDFGDDPTIKEKCDALEKFSDQGFISY